MRYNKFEREVARLLDKWPTIRDFSKYLYQKMSYLLYHKKGFSYTLIKEASIKGILKKKDRHNFEVFFGYYDKSPWNSDGKYYLVHIYDHKHRNKLLIGVYDCAKDNLNILTQTKAFNFQQGAMLTWLNSHLCILNDVYENRLVSKIIDVKNGKEVKIIDTPIYAINADGKEALTLNFKRLAKIRPEYGYKVDVINFSENMDYDEDGIWKVKLSSGKKELIISLSQLIKINHQKSMDKSQHKVNHIMYSPSGKRFLFMHRWVGPYGKFSRLYSANSNGTDLYCLADDRMVSHYCWLDDKYIIAWARKKFIGDKYFLFKDKSDEFHIIGNGILDVYGDGHPSVSLDKEWVITDTYPNKARIRELILFNLKTEKIKVIGSFFAPWKYNGSYRCDLHPRWSPSGKEVSIDSAHEGFRNSYIIDLSRII